MQSRRLHKLQSAQLPPSRVTADISPTEQELLRTISVSMAEVQMEFGAACISNASVCTLEFCRVIVI